MSDRSFQFHGSQGGAAISVRITPRSSKNEVHEVMDNGTVKIRLTTPQVDGAINTALIGYLGEILGISSSRIEIVAGMSGRDKLVAINGLDAETVQRKILEHIS